VSVESPAYEVIRHDGAFEVRRYEAYIRATVHVAASSYGQATNAGFNPLADYIFGNNRGSDKIAMTVPVSAGRASGEKIAMTAPVTAAESDGYYVVSFTMPSSYSMENLPLPNNPNVVIESVEPHVVAAVTFSGYMSDKSGAKAQLQLEEWMRGQGLTAAGEPVSAQYNAPWIPGFARHNEIMIPVDWAAGEMH
jgi:hypothetical protein